MSGSQQPDAAGTGPARSWRPQQTRKAARSARRLKVACGSIFLAALVGLLVWLFFRHSQVQTITFIGIGRTDYQRADLPLNAGARQDVVALLEVFQAIRDENADQVAELADTEDALHEGLVAYLERSCSGAKTLVVYCSLHGHVADNGGKPVVELLVGAAPEVRVENGEPNPAISLNSLLDLTDNSPAEHIVLLLDAAAGPVWSLGLFKSDVMQQIEREVRQKKLDKRFSIICGTSGHQTSWAIPWQRKSDDSESPDWKNQPGTVFGQAVRDAFCDSAADTNGNTVLEVDELLAYVKAQCGRWNQDVVLLTPPTTDSVELTETRGTPPSAADSDGSGESAADAKKESKEELSPRDRLEKLWAARDSLWLTNPDADELPDRAGVLSSTRPLTWRQFNQQLVWVEEAIRYELDKLPDDARRIRQRLENLEQQLAGLTAAESDSDVVLPSIVWGAGPLTEPQAAAAAGAYDKLMAETKAAAGDPPPAEGPTPLATRADRMAFARWLVSQVMSAQPEELSGKLTDVAAVLQVLDAPPGIRWRKSMWPFELLCLQEIADAFSGSSLSRDDAITIRRAIGIREDISRLGGLLQDESLRPEIQTKVRGALEGSLNSIVSAERWLLANQMDRANKWLDRAVKQHPGKRHLEEAKRLNRDTLQLIEIRETLLAELPDHAFWVASRLEYQGVPFKSSIRAADSPAAAALLDLFEDLESATSLLADNTDSLTEKKVSDLVRRTTKNRERLDQAIQEHCLSLESAARWPEIDYALRNPWIRAAARTKLLNAFQARKSGADPGSSSDGVWHDFWSAKTLSLVFDDQALRFTPSKDLDTRLQNRWLLAEKWTELNGLLKTDSDPRYDRAVRLANVSTPPTEVEQQLAAQRSALRRELHTLVASSWARRGDPYIETIGRATASVLDRDAAGRIRDPQLEEFPTFVRCDSSSAAKIAISWSGGRAGESMNLILLGSDVRWSDQTEPVRKTEFGETVGIRLTSRSPRSILLALARPAAAATDRNDDVMDIRSLTVAPEFNARGWGVAFVLPEPPGTKELFQRALEQEEAATELWLNANHSVRTRLQLRRPGGSPAGVYQVQLLTEDRGGNQRATGLAGTATFAKDQSVTPLQLAAAEGANVPKDLDVSAGLAFRVQAEDGQQLEIRVAPWIRAAEDFLAERPRCEIRDGQLTVTVRRKVNPGGTLPPQIEFTVEPGQRLRELCQPAAPQTRKLDTDVVSLPVVFKLDPKVADTPEKYEVSLSVAGVPHAYRWKLGADGPQTLLSGYGREDQRPQPTVRIATPNDGSFVSSKDKLAAVRIDVDTAHADYNRVAAGTLRLFIKLDGQTLDFVAWPNVRGPSRKTTLNLRDQLIELSTSMRDYTFPAKDLASKMATSGNYELVAQLSRGGQVVDETSIRYGLDTTAPEVVWLKPPRVVNGQWALTRSPTGGRVLQTQASVFDRDSPIRSYRLKIRRDGNNVGPPVILNPGKEVFNILIPTNRLPTEPGTYEFVLEAENAAGLVGKNPTRRVVTIREPPPKPEPGK